MCCWCHQYSSPESCIHIYLNHYIFYASLVSDKALKRLYEGPREQQKAEEATHLLRLMKSNARWVKKRLNELIPTPLLLEALHRRNLEDRVTRRLALKSFKGRVSLGIEV